MSADPPARATGLGDAEVDVLHTAEAGPKVVRGTAMRVAGYGLGAVITAAAAVLLLRYLGVETFGRYATVMAIIAIVSGISDAGLTVVGTRELARRQAGRERRDLLGHIIGLRLVLTPLGAAGAVVFAAAIGYEGELVIGTALAGAALVLAHGQAALAGLLPVELRNVRLTLTEVIRQVATLAVVGGLVALGASLVAFFAGQIVVAIVLLAISPLLIGPGWATRPRFSRNVWWELMREAVPVAVAYALALIYFRLLLILLSLVSTETETGLFGISLRVFEILLGIPVLAVGVALPVVTAAVANPQRFRYQVRLLSEGVLLLATFVALVTALAADAVITLLGGEDFSGAGPVLQVHVIGFVPMFLSNVAQVALIAMGRQRVMVAVNLIALAFLLLIGYPLVEAHGARGAAIAAAIAETFLCALLVVALARHGERVLPPVSFLARLALAAALGVGVGVLPGLPAPLAAATGALAFGAGALALRLAPPELFAAFRRQSPPAATT
jgi:O-antigen/teichoic acid export membrane protein